MDVGPAAQGRCDSSAVNERFTRAYATHYQSLMSYLKYRTHDAAAAEDVASATFEFAWRRIEEMPEEPETRAWLFSISKTVLSNYWRSTTRQHRLLSKIATASILVAPPFAGTDDELPLQALNALGSRERIALHLVYWDGLRHSEAAEVLGCSVNAFDILIHRARRRMLEILTTVPSETWKTSKGL
jgi:RNA polymerase sigma factor (sigma-70 family)